MGRETENRKRGETMTKQTATPAQQILAIIQHATHADFADQYEEAAARAEARHNGHEVASLLTLAVQRVEEAVSCLDQSKRLEGVYGDAPDSRKMRQVLADLINPA